METIKTEALGQLAKLTPQKDSGVSNEDIYDHIELTEKEIEIALRIAKKEKHFVIKNREYAEKLKEEKPALRLDSENMLKYILGKRDYLRLDFKVDDYNMSIVTDLCDYFTETDGGRLDQSKGLLMFGSVGCGKTTLMRLFNENQKGSYRIAPCKVIADKMLKAGNDADEVVREYSRLYSNSTLAVEFKNGSTLGVCFDDLGTEEQIKIFGNGKSPMTDIILRCYDNYLMKGRVHLTTNLTSAQLQEYYGDRFFSRIIEMFNVIEFPENVPDYRKLNA